jgi:putative ABC transport system permease protein
VEDSFMEPSQSSSGRSTGGNFNPGGGRVNVPGGGGFSPPGTGSRQESASGPNPDAPALYGQTIQLELHRNNNGKQETRVVQLLIAGVLEPTGGSQDYSIYMSFRSLEDLLTWSQGERPDWQRDGYSQVLVITEQDAQTTLDVQSAITDLGYNAQSSTSVVESLNTTFLVIEAALVGIASIALFVAAIGIANTMIMSVLERTHEIGLMKAVGARNRDVLTIFISESGAIGVLGGLVGLTTGILIAHGIDLFAAGLLSTQGATASSVILIPLWLPVFALLFSMGIGLAAGIYPAFRAVLLDPVQALKHE